ncbi:PREDICTED: zinc finger FYVE domain-containing protein 26 [Thamnophis sirtalis]|uniref:Zinc finger FYVE domain-containing protein 26 n=1 Tax=Thamnophis sirtalis TaxID=35019 RepID=A0A6I9XIV2_9SAUR|nr:PREDICTED: zinc finger FYVE domain-containing protein 26 [Thamnophis sirtalis]
MYPFGREEAASLERLFWFFSECMQRGDWELARACVPQLQQLQDDGSEKVEKILHALIICPSRLRSESKHSPQKLAWFWLLVLQEWLSHKQKTVPAVLQRETEFLLLLEELEKDVPFGVLKELYEAFEDNHLLHRKQRDGSVQKFGVELMSTLQKMLLQAPRKLQSILELLQRDPVECSSSVIQSGLPQNIFVGFLWDSLKCLKRLQLNPELLEREGNKVTDEIYNALSMLNLKVDNQTRELRLLCRELLDACWFEQSPLREERLLSCMLRKDSHALLSLFGSVFIEKMKEKLLSQKLPGKGTSEHPDAERVVMALFLDHEHAYSWKAAYFYYLSSNKHFLEQILITALTLLKREDFSSLSRLLTQEFSYLSRLLILLGWTQCCSLESAKMLLQTLHKSQGFYNDSVLKDFCDGLCAQVEVLEWCIQQNSNCIPDNVLLQHLHSLECHSSLYLLYQLTDLLALNEEAVIELFQKIPTKYTKVQDSAVMPDVRLLSQQHNLTLYKAFCAMKYAIYALCVKSHRGSNCRHCANYFVTELPHKLLEKNEFPSQLLYPDTDYASLFPHYLSKCQNYLRSIPAPLRLELLENIFSLLFVSSSDLYGVSPQEEDNAEDAGFRKKSHLGKRAERCASQDSSTTPSPQHSVSPEMTVHAPTFSATKSNQALFNLESSNINCGSFGLSYLDLKHFTSNICGFLVDEEALEIFLKMLMEHLKEIEDSFVWDSRHIPTMELALLDSLNLSVNKETFNSRVQQLSKYLSEAQWRHRIVLSNKNTGSHRDPTRTNYSFTKASFLKKHTQSQRQKPEHKRTSNSSQESSSSELSVTSTSGMEELSYHGNPHCFCLRNVYLKRACKIFKCVLQNTQVYSLKQPVNGWQYLFPVRDAVLRSRLSLRYLDRWPLEACLEILAYCACDPEVTEELKFDLQSKIKELQVYQKILRLQAVHIWHDWQDLKRTCTEDPQSIVAMVLEAKDYELCEEWGRLYSIPRDHLISLHQEHLLHLLEMGDMEKALQLLQRIDDPDIQFVISERCLDRYPSLAASHFLADYLTTYFNQHLTVMRQNEIQALYVGSKVLLTLPEPSRSNYSHLSCKPLLMLEQLLMNMKVDWAAVAVQMLHQLLVGQKIGFSTGDIDALLSSYAGKALDFPFSLREKRSDSLIPIQENLCPGSESDTLSKSESTEHFPASSPDTTHASNPKEKSLQQAACAQDFVPPEKPPPKQQWIPDDTEDTCMVCKTERFTMFNRRHHCRRCGRLVCRSCSTKNMVVEACKENPARVCDQCYSYFNKEYATTTSQDSEISNEEDQNQEAVVSSDKERSDYSAVVQIPKPAEFEWQLSLMEEDNKTMRSEFFYEQAPSASLCIAIFKLHSDSIACGQQLIDYCCKLSRSLANPEVDASLLIDIMKQLLFSAKMMFVKAGRSQELALCDSYLSKVDVLNILVAAAYRHVPSLDQILEPAAVSRLRNQLLQAEYYQLSVEVTLQDDDYFATLKELEAILRTRSLSLEMTPEGKMQHNSYYQECLFYLHNYGTNLAIINFYMRHNCMREALLHLLNKESPPDLFIEGIFTPSYKSGKLHMLENLLETIDPGLESWGIYLIAACKHLQKKNYYHILYELQQFMKDQVRAAMTCIRFFTDKAKSYTELKERQKWLLKVKDHLKVYLQEVSRSSGRKKFACSFRKKMSAPDVSRHINTVELQMEVTKFLHRCEKSGTLSVGDLPVPTLFGNNQMKIEVVCKVMLEGKNIEEGFGISFRILQDFQLDVAAIYNKVARQLVKQQSYSEIRQLIKCIKESGAADKNDGDNVILSCLDEFDSIPAEELDNLIQDMDSDENKIQAYLKCHKLRSAYLISVKQENVRAVQLVQHIQQMAEDGGDDVVQAICTQWLSVHHTKPRSWLTQNSKK